MSPRSERTTDDAPTRGSGLGRAAKVVVLLFALAVGGIAVAAWFAGDPETLPLEYEGFD